MSLFSIKEGLSGAQQSSPDQTHPDVLCPILSQRGGQVLLVARPEGRSDDQAENTGRALCHEGDSGVRGRA